MEWDPSRVTYKELLDLFWTIHDPTQLNRQGVDYGTQYRSAIFYHDMEQEEEAVQSMKEHQAKYLSRIVTEIKPFTIFWEAEEYHQKYLDKHPERTCH